MSICRKISVFFIEINHFEDKSVIVLRREIAR